MDFEGFLDQLTPELYHTMRESLALGKWPNGQTIDLQQQETVLQALIVYEHEHIAKDQRIGYMPQACQSQRPLPQDGTSEADNIIRFNR